MNLEMIVSNYAGDNIACSLYQLPTGEYTIWLKVFAALIEIREQDIDHTMAVLLETLQDLEKVKEGTLNA